jgi:hypothetical protein
MCSNETWLKDKTTDEILKVPEKLSRSIERCSRWDKTRSDCILLEKNLSVNDTIDYCKGIMVKLYH